MRPAMGRSAVKLLAVTAAALSMGAPAADAATIQVRNEREFRAAVAALRSTGGTIMLAPGEYRERLLVPARSGRPLRIAGLPGARVERLLISHAENVYVGPLRISPFRRNAALFVVASRNVQLRHLLVTAEGTRFTASVRTPYSRGVTIRRSEFRHCGDRSSGFAMCLLPRPTSSKITVEDNWFHDCYGCDFIHGRSTSDLVIRRNRFERALPCTMDEVRCSHQDLIELFRVDGLLIERNHFGVYAKGGGQVLLAGAVDHATIVNNVFVATDRRVRGYRARLGVGLAGRLDAPRYAKVVNNTILSGAQRENGYAGSIFLSTAYRDIPREQRPVIANNVLGLQETAEQVCRNAGTMVANVVLRGRACSDSDAVGPAKLDRRLRPTAASTLLIDQASTRYAPRTDRAGRPRDGDPDIGAYEYVGSRFPSLLALLAPGR
jgi:hypothetical protein